jgi:hypothetical protein
MLQLQPNNNTPSRQAAAAKGLEQEDGEPHGSQYNTDGSQGFHLAIDGDIGLSAFGLPDLPDFFVERDIFVSGGFRWCPDF